MYRVIILCVMVLPLIGCQTLNSKVSTRFDGQWIAKFESRTPHICGPEETETTFEISNGSFYIDQGVGKKSITIDATITSDNTLKATGSLFTIKATNTVNYEFATYMVSADMKPYSAIVKIIPAKSHTWTTTLCEIVAYFVRPPYSIADVQNSVNRSNESSALNSTAKKLKDLKQLQLEGFINQEEYDERKRVFLDSVYGVNDTEVTSVYQKFSSQVEDPTGERTTTFGDYHALVIGINDYRSLPKLRTAVNDAKVVADILVRDYGFDVELLKNPTRTQIVDAFDRMAEILGPEDNLLIYYAGHGWLDPATKRGFWLPKDALKNRRSKWISNATITDTLRAVTAKHVMVVADSCYSGTLTRAGNTSVKTPKYIRRMVKKKARVVLTSGGLEPVSDGVGQNSPFAQSFVKVLNQNTGILDGTGLFSMMRMDVMKKVQQVPEYSDVHNAGHDGGDFIFVKNQ